MKTFILMTGNNLLDTNIVIELFKGNATITTFLESLEGNINIPFAVLGELYLGAYRSVNPQKHISQINSFLERCNVLIVDDETAFITLSSNQHCCKKEGQYRRMIYG